MKLSGCFARFPEFQADRTGSDPWVSEGPALTGKGGPEVPSADTHHSHTQSLRVAVPTFHTRFVLVTEGLVEGHLTTAGY